VSIITFVNKLGREGRDPFDLSDEIKPPPALEVTVALLADWQGRDFPGIVTPSELMPGSGYCTRPPDRRMRVSEANVGLRGGAV
jgi:hypothetical protein